MNGKDILTEENHTEVIESHIIDRDEKESVSVEQNISIVNIEMGKRSLLEKIDYDAVGEWISSHVIHLVIGTVFMVYTIALLIMGAVILREKKTINTLTSTETTIVQKQPENMMSDENQEMEAVEVNEITDVVETETIAAEDEKADQEEELEDIVEPVTELDLYELPIVGGSFSEKRYSATNTVGEKLDKIFYLSSGIYTETVGFYLNGEYDRFTANISCDENTSNTSFDVNVYLDDGPCVQTIHIERLMAKVPIEIDTTGATFIKFDITGSFYNHGAILSDGVLHIKESGDANG